MTSEATIAAIRFGYGLGPTRKPVDRAALISGLSDKDAIGAKYPMKSTRKVLAQIRAFQTAKKAEAAKKPEKRNKNLPARIALQKSTALGLIHGTARILDTDNAFFERLNWFWADHFTAIGKNLPNRAVGPAYLDEATRPHIHGRFSDMLKAVITHPFMLAYLDQANSVGPNSQLGKRRKKGLNENLARELLELHTLGVGGAYRQQDVRQLAELLTGLTVSKEKGFVFDHKMSEPGVKTILGKSYGRRVPDLNGIFAALDDLAIHTDTARHIATKLAVHFVSDTPDEAMISHMTAAYQASGGDLKTVYRAMLEHPAAWGPLGNKAKQPFDFVMSSLVAIGPTGKEFLRLKEKDMRNLLSKPLVVMGQPFMQAGGPDGWPEKAEEWITPQGLANRIAWSVKVAEKIANNVGGPTQFLRSTLADAAGERLTSSVQQVENAADGVTLVLASAEFNRR